MEHDKILITGSSKGIGRAITEKLLESEVEVVGVSRKIENLYPENKNFFHYNVDLADLTTLSKQFSLILKEHPNISGLVSNAGYGKFSSIENFSNYQIQNYINVNLVSHILVTSILLPHFKSKKFGNIVFIGSEAALFGSKKGSLYCAAKFGLRGFSQSIREESADRNIGVSIVNPGMVRTNFFDDLSFKPGPNPDNAIEAEDVADAVLSIFSMRRGTVIDEINLSPLKKVVNFD